MTKSFPLLKYVKNAHGRFFALKILKIINEVKRIKYYREPNIMTVSLTLILTDANITHCQYQAEIFYCSSHLARQNNFAFVR